MYATMNPQAKGRLTKDEGDKFFLTNREGQRFNIDPTVGILWKLCDGQTHIKQITDTYKQLLGISVDSEIVRGNLESTLLQLRQNKLVD
ncbi:MAG: PqqD family peptide modification chaperone [Candidatus Altiarchaeales archaeon]|nr:PqqD family peptide modification chaperone [Candidatus Altiarchaeales archaeon]